MSPQGIGITTTYKTRVALEKPCKECEGILIGQLKDRRPRAAFFPVWPNVLGYASICLRYCKLLSSQLPTSQNPTFQLFGTNLLRRYSTEANAYQWPVGVRCPAPRR